MHLAGFIVALSALVVADAAEKGEGDERGLRRRALQGFSMSMSAPLFSVEGIEVPAFVLGKEEDITVSTLAIGSTVSKGAEEKPEEDIGAAAEKSKEVKAEKTEKAPKAEKVKGSKGRKLASDKVARQGAVQQADIPMAMSAPQLLFEGTEVPIFALGDEKDIPLVAPEENSDKGSKGRKLARDNSGSRRELQGFSMSMSAPLFSVEGVEVPTFALGKEEDITVSTFAIGSTVSKGAEEKPEEDIGAAAETSKVVKAEKKEKAPKAEKNKGSKGRKLASDKVERQGAVQQADIPMAMSAPMSMSTESIEVPTFEVPTFGIAENDKALNDMGSKGRKLARDFQHR
jgi:hypothetical protein